MPDDAGDFSGALIDVSGISLADLNQIGESRITVALRRVLEDEDTGPVAGFTSRI